MINQELFIHAEDNAVPVLYAGRYILEFYTNMMILILSFVHVYRYHKHCLQFHDNIEMHMKECGNQKLKAKRN